MKNIVLDLYKGAPAPPAVTVRAGDSNAVKVSASVSDHGAQFPLDGWSVRFLCRMRSGERASAQCSTSGSTAEFSMPRLSTVGKPAAAYLELSREGDVVTTQDMEVRVVA